MYASQTPIDLTLPIKPDMLCYPGDSPPRLHRLSSLDKGDALTASELSIGCHIGTHVDAPAHFVHGGLTVDQLPAKHFFGPAIVVDLTSCVRIDVGEVDKIRIPSGHHLLLKTANSALLHANDFSESYVHVTREAAEFLVKSEPLSVGIDYYSLDPFGGPKYPAHELIAEKGLPAFVCLDLQSVAEGEYCFSAFALPVLGAEGLPVRALLWPRSA
jgi:arylformamidase